MAFEDELDLLFAKLKVKNPNKIATLRKDFLDVVNEKTLKWMLPRIVYGTAEQNPSTAT